MGLGRMGKRARTEQHGVLRGSFAVKGREKEYRMRSRGRGRVFSVQNSRFL